MWSEDSRTRTCIDKVEGELVNQQITTKIEYFFMTRQNYFHSGRFKEHSVLCWNTVLKLGSNPDLAIFMNELRTHKYLLW